MTEDLDKKIDPTEEQRVPFWGCTAIESISVLSTFPPLSFCRLGFLHSSKEMGKNSSENAFGRN